MSLPTATRGSGQEVSELARRSMPQGEPPADASSAQQPTAEQAQPPCPGGEAFEQFSSAPQPPQEEPSQGTCNSGAPKATSPLQGQEPLPEQPRESTSGEPPPVASDPGSGQHPPMQLAHPAQPAQTASARSPRKAAPHVAAEPPLAQPNSLGPARRPAQGPQAAARAPNGPAQLLLCNDRIEMMRGMANHDVRGPGTPTREEEGDPPVEEAGPPRPAAGGDSAKAAGPVGVSSGVQAGSVRNTATAGRTSVVDRLREAGAGQQPAGVSGQPAVASGGSVLARGPGAGMDRPPAGISRHAEAAGGGLAVDRGPGTDLDRPLAGVSGQSLVAGEGSALARGPGAGIDPATAIRRQRAFDLNSQTIAGIAFFVALGCYQNKDLAMVVGLCLEMWLYWDEFGCPRTAACRTSMRERTVPLPPWQLRWGKKQTRAKQRTKAHIVGTSRLSRVTLPGPAPASGFIPLKGAKGGVYRHGPIAPLVGGAANKEGVQRIQPQPPPSSLLVAESQRRSRALAPQQAHQSQEGEGHGAGDGEGRVAQGRQETSIPGGITKEKVSQITLGEPQGRPPLIVTPVVGPEVGVAVSSQGGSLASSRGGSLAGSEAQGGASGGAVGGTISAPEQGGASGGGGEGTATSISLPMPPRPTTGSNHRKKSQPLRSAPQGADPGPPMPMQLPSGKQQAKKRKRTPSAQPPLPSPQASQPSPPLLKGFATKVHVRLSPKGATKKRSRPRSGTSGEKGSTHGKAEAKSGEKASMQGKPEGMSGEGGAKQGKAEGEKARSRKPKKPRLEKETVQQEPTASKEGVTTPPPPAKLGPAEGVFSPTHLVVGNAVLVRTEQDEGDTEWGKCWSLGRLIGVHHSRKTMDVVWLKPRMQGKRISQFTTLQLMGLQWVPWKTPANKGRYIDWTSKGLVMSSIQYGLKLPRDGIFSVGDQNTLAAEVGRLEGAPQPLKAV